jgi:hypothetical protein
VRLFKIGFVLVVLPFVVGLLIYSTWFVLLHFFAIKQQVLELIGFYWVFISIPLATIGLIIVLIDFLRGRKGNVCRFVSGMSLGLINVPILIWVLLSQSTVSGRAYLKIENESGRELYNLIIQEPDNETYFGNLEGYTSTVVYYKPDYKNDGDGKYPGISENYLVIDVSDKEVKLKLPIIHPGEIHRITINEKLELESLNLYVID